MFFTSPNSSQILPTFLSIQFYVLSLSLSKAKIWNKNKTRTHKNEKKSKQTNKISISQKNVLTKQSYTKIPLSLVYVG